MCLSVVTSFQSCVSLFFSGVIRALLYVAEGKRLCTHPHLSEFLCDSCLVGPWASGLLAPDCLVFFFFFVPAHVEALPLAQNQFDPSTPPTVHTKAGSLLFPVTVLSVVANSSIMTLSTFFFLAPPKFGLSPVSAPSQHLFARPIKSVTLWKRRRTTSLNFAWLACSKNLDFFNPPAATSLRLATVHLVRPSSTTDGIMRGHLRTAYEFVTFFTFSRTRFLAGAHAADARRYEGGMREV